MTQQIEVIPYHTQDAEKAVESLVEEAETEIEEVEDLKHFLKQSATGVSSINDLPNTDEFKDRWWSLSKPDEEYEFFQERLDDLMEEHNLSERVYADMYDEFTLMPQYEDAAEAVVNSLQNNDVITPQLASTLYEFMNVSQSARQLQIEDFQTEKQRLQHYQEELDEIVNSFEEMNQDTLPLEVDTAAEYWDNLESFDERVERIRTERQNDYDGEDYNAVNLHGFLQDFYGEEIGVRQPVMADLNAVDSRTEEAKNNIYI